MSKVIFPTERTETFEKKLLKLIFSASSVAGLH